MHVAGPLSSTFTIRPAAAMPQRLQSQIRRPNICSPLRPTGAATAIGEAVRQACAAKASPKVATPFKAPTFLHGQGHLVASDQATRKRSLGTTRPSSIVAYKCLQSDWAQFSESAVAAGSKKGSRPESDDEERRKRAKETLARLMKDGQEDFVAVNQAPPTGADAADWLFD